jgi:hypothetical protein
MRESASLYSRLGAPNRKPLQCGIKTGPTYNFRVGNLRVFSLLGGDTLIKISHRQLYKLIWHILLKLTERQHRHSLSIS